MTRINLVDSRGRPLGAVETVEGKALTLTALKALIQEATSLNQNRQRVSIETSKGWQHLTVDSFPLPPNIDKLQVKDLGPQIAWKSVFIVEYAGPIIIHTLYYFYYRPISLLQLVSYLLIVFHFVKRELETLFVHRFSHGTMPLSNLFKNSAHYWLLSGVLIAHNLYRKDIVGTPLTRIGLWSILMVVFELANARTHLVLMHLRPPGTTHRSIPYGLGFSLVSCPNYLFELLAWIAFGMLTRLWSAWIFTAIAGAQMYVWAVKKHKRYEKEFGTEYKKLRRAPMIPFLR